MSLSIVALKIGPSGVEDAAVFPLSETHPQMPDILQPGEQYRIARADLGGYRYSVDYDEGNFIQVKIVSGPTATGLYRCTTFGDDGKHLGPGGGWTRDYEQNGGCTFHRSDLEPLT